MFKALKSLCNLRQEQNDYFGATLFSEEAYDFVVEAYDCFHPQVHEAAGELIDIVIMKGDLCDAERYAQVNYGNLRDKKNGIDQEGNEMAIGAYNLANAILKQNGVLIKAKALARDCLRIRTLIYGCDHYAIVSTCDLLDNILSLQNKSGEEPRETCFSYFN